MNLLDLLDSFLVLLLINVVNDESLLRLWMRLRHLDTVVVDSTVTLKNLEHRRVVQIFLVRLQELEKLFFKLDTEWLERRV